MYERGLAHVTSDTVCFPAKLVHGHIRNLVDAGVDRIVFQVQSEDRDEMLRMLDKAASYQKAVET